MRNAGESLSIEIAPVPRSLNNTALRRAIEAIEAIDAGQAQLRQSRSGLELNKPAANQRNVWVLSGSSRRAVARRIGLIMMLCRAGIHRRGLLAGNAEIHDAGEVVFCCRLFGLREAHPYGGSAFTKPEA
jgi:hypothetical protein